MSKIKQLVESYARHIAIPWRDDAAPAQRVIFCVYPEYTELRLRARLDEFEIATQRADHNWALFDLTDSFPNWMGSQRYAKAYFAAPEKLTTLWGKYEDYIVEQFTQFCEDRSVGDDDVVALAGVGTLFGFLKVKGVVDKLAPLVPGRLVVFFPGSYEDNNYRLLDAYDGWGYLAVPITADR
ncbi:DUF1788 domain-containing protein [Stieleria sp. ICT_E10.1]|uniref:DUF1788 domain-containing protein n=1 Tax=Stieleria sedimenti TaxID=2976331 RepID=UPI0021805C25|nr:DUF1788 domain-containing protein [Stieleria sedimenti]MCS7466130.1 DUF1788 domain-containing protein [Stieleria sedimenti]